MKEEELKFPKQDPSFIDTICAIVLKGTDISVEKMFSKTRKREIVEVRQIAMTLAKIFVKASLSTIGSRIGGKDHATVLHANKTIKNLCDTNIIFRNRFDKLLEECIEAIPQHRDETIVCAFCGGTNIGVLTWINPNTMKMKGSRISITNEADNWCSDCGKPMLFTTRADFEEVHESVVNEQKERITQLEIEEVLEKQISLEEERLKKERERKRIQMIEYNAQLRQLEKDLGV